LFAEKAGQAFFEPSALFCFDAAEEEKVEHDLLILALSDLPNPDHSFVEGIQEPQENVEILRGEENLRPNFFSRKILGSVTGILLQSVEPDRFPLVVLLEFAVKSWKKIGGFVVDIHPSMDIDILDFVQFLFAHWVGGSIPIRADLGLELFLLELSAETLLLRVFPLENLDQDHLQKSLIPQLFSISRNRRIDVK